MDYSAPVRPATPLPPIHEDMSPEEFPARCESRMSQRPQLRRTPASYRLPKLYSFDDEDDFDDDSDPAFSPALFSHPQASFAPRGFDTNDHADYCADMDDDDDFGELIRFRLDDADAQDAFPPPSLAPLLLPQAEPVPCTEDIFCTHTPPAYHGLSYHALALVKRVWNCRRAHWSSRTSPGSPDPSVAYDGIALPLSEPDYPLPDDYASPAAATPAPESRVAAADPDVPIYPRLGDLCSLRDARAAAVDRAFCNFPLYTIRKVLYLDDMLDRAAGRADAVGVLCAQFARAMGLDGGADLPSLEPVAERGWETTSFARWRVLLEKATGRPVPLSAVSELANMGGDLSHSTDQDQGFDRAPQRPKTPTFFLLDDDDEDEDEDEEDRLGVSGDSDEGWNEISLESPERRGASMNAPVFFFDRRMMPHPMPVGHPCPGIMAH